MPDDEDVDLPDIRVITITLRAPDWIPETDWGSDLDDFSAVKVLEIAAELEDQKLRMLMGLDGSDDDSDE